MLKQAPTQPPFPGNNLLEERLWTDALFGTYMARIKLPRISAAIGTTTNQQHADYWEEARPHRYLPVRLRPLLVDVGIRSRERRPNTVGDAMSSAV